MGLDEYHDGCPDHAEPDRAQRTRRPSRRPPTAPSRTWADSDMKDRAGAAAEGIHLGAMAGVVGLFATPRAAACNADSEPPPANRPGPDTFGRGPFVIS